MLEAVGSCILDRIGIWKCWCLWREEIQRIRRKTLGVRTRTNNKLNPHMTPDRIEPIPYWKEERALTTAPPATPPTSRFSLHFSCNFCFTSRSKKDYLKSKWHHNVQFLLQEMPGGCIIFNLATLVSGRHSIEEMGHSFQSQFRFVRMALVCLQLALFVG